MSKKLYRLKYVALESAERRRDKLAFHMEVTYYEILDTEGFKEADKLYSKWLKEQEQIDEALAHVVGRADSPKVEGKYWAVLNDCINRVSAL